MQKLRQNIRNPHVKDKLKAKDPSAKGMELIFRERMHENCKNICLIHYLQRSVFEALNDAQQSWMDFSFEVFLWDKRF